MSLTKKAFAFARRRKLLVAGGAYVSLAILFGIFSGLGIFTFGYGKGASYLSNNPASCANCHVMNDHYDSWQNSSHSSVATCNDCHLSPHPVGKWVTKADNGFFHSLAFTTGNYPDPIRIKPRNRKVTQMACLKCHSDFVHAMLPEQEGGDMLDCAHCHTAVGHAHR
jgi:cytochrome c nitrite reductase small subunit